MTVIAWDSKTLSSDSCVSTTSGYYVGQDRKIFRLKSGGMLGTAGDSDCRAVISLLDSIKDGNDIPSRAELESLRTQGEYLLVLPDKSAWTIDIYFDEDIKAFMASVNEVRSKFTAIGHGQDFARTAMSLGKTSAEAVKEACKWSLTCRLPVQSMKLEDKPKEKIKRVRQPKLVPEPE